MTTSACDWGLLAACLWCGEDDDGNDGDDDDGDNDEDDGDDDDDYDVQQQ